MELNEKEEKKLESSKKSLLSQDVKIYQSVQEPGVVIGKDDDDKSEHTVESVDELKDETDHKKALSYITKKCKFKQEYVDNHIILSVNHLKQYFSFGSGLSKYILNYLPDIKLDRQSLNLVNGLYFTTRYPGDESIVVEKEDIEEYVEAVKKCKKAVDEFIQSRE